MSPSELFPPEIEAGLSFLRSREDWIFAPQNPEDIDAFQQIIASVHSWAVDCLKTGALIQDGDTQAWRLLAYLEADLFLTMLALVASERSLHALMSDQSHGGWNKIAADRLKVLNVFAAMSSILSKENISRIRRALVP